MNSVVAKSISSVLAFSATCFAVVMKPWYGNPTPPAELMESKK